MKNYKLVTALMIMIATIVMTWIWSTALIPALAASLPWAIYHHALYLTGLLAIGLLSVTMALGVWPASLKWIFGGPGQGYIIHKWVGVSAVMFGVAHWLIEMGDDLIETLFGEAGQMPEEEFSGFVDLMRDTAEAAGEWAIYVVTALAAIALWKRFPHKAKRILHKAMPALYLMLAFHALWLAPVVWWSLPVGGLMALLLLIGVLAAVLSLGATLKNISGSVNTLRGSLETNKIENPSEI